MATLELRPRSATEIIDASFQLLRTNYVALATLSVAAHLPVLVVSVTTYRIPMGMNATPEEVTRWMSGANASTYVAAGLLVLLLTIVAQCAVTAGVGQVYLGEAVDAAGAARRAFRRFLTIILAVLALAFLVGIASLALIVPAVAFLKVAAPFVIIFGGIYVGVRMATLNCVLVLEDNGPLASLGRAWALGGGRFWHILSTIVLALCIYVGVLLVGMALLFGLQTLVPAVKNPSVSDVFSTAISAAVFPLVISISVVLYYDLRIRHEGFDVEMMSKALTI